MSAAEQNYEGEGVYEGGGGSAVLGEELGAVPQGEE